MGEGDHWEGCVCVHYSSITHTNSWYASDWAGLFGFGVSKRSWMPKSICLMVMAGLHPSSSSKILEQQTFNSGKKSSKQAKHARNRQERKKRTWGGYIHIYIER